MTKEKVIELAKAMSRLTSEQNGNNERHIV